MSGPAKTTVTDTIYAPDGSLANGKLLVSTTETFTSADEFVILQGFSIWVPVTDGEFTVELVPNEESTPASTYTVKMEMTQGYFTQEWNVPSSESPVDLAAVIIT